MKQICSKTYNINDDIVGRITFGKSNIFCRTNEILVRKDINKPLFGYSATITENESFSGMGKPYCIVSSIEQFQEGDVVVLNKQGEIIFVYEISSNHNAIMATERCNHRCVMCPQPPILKEKDKTLFNLNLVSLFDKSTQEIGITGGEPTLIEDNLFVLIRHIQKRLPKASISILSNGVKFAEKEYAAKLAKCHHRDLQIDIPLFSDIAQEHNRIVGAKTFYKTVQGLYNLALFRQRIGLRIVVHKQTYKRLPQFADFIYHNFPFVSQVAFMQMETTGLAKDNIKELWIDPFDYNEQLREAVLLLADRGMKPYIYNAQLCILPEDIRRYAQQSISDWKDIYIPECDGCVLQGQCAGFFESNRDAHSSHIKKVENISDDILC
ncbi:His-Xaa-Ser system radical SAM maturase HxsC [Parabacteroides sp. 52]|uniref:His-Xaa-Ser system radical SAM maturase HxsC n=1 Tax=unclassified Parabacteroides TaxID=2649774 RepID=UPI0013D4688B|nr:MULTISPECIES: His-Xaa-Ser system radical SAM maturase HxsC [unclassified Parabacteroides]MDH6534817.1 His-Xaa-Ser system radical SAM maturase HxsC [Parabacteroides sp. PM5-20]NDV55537.1 His-Xaa-Ser system radical SAM maturase HxsC [Parabacteroides sp. 52]